jgi:hypothetical protein
MVKAVGPAGDIVREIAAEAWAVLRALGQQCR